MPVSVWFCIHVANFWRRNFNELINEFRSTNQFNLFVGRFWKLTGWLTFPVGRPSNLSDLRLMLRTSNSHQMVFSIHAGILVLSMRIIKRKENWPISLDLGEIVVWLSPSLLYLIQDITEVSTVCLHCT